MDAHARASGKLLLAYSDEALRTAYLSTQRLDARTKNTITTLPELYEEFERIRATGYSTDLEEFSTGLCWIAFGIGGGVQPCALTLSAPTERFPRSSRPISQPCERSPAGYRELSRRAPASTIVWPARSLSARSSWSWPAEIVPHITSN